MTDSEKLDLIISELENIKEVIADLKYKTTYVEDRIIVLSGKVDTLGHRIYDVELRLGDLEEESRDVKKSIEAIEQNITESEPDIENNGNEA